MQLLLTTNMLNIPYSVLMQFSFGINKAFYLKVCLLIQYYCIFYVCQVLKGQASKDSNSKDSSVRVVLL